VQQHTKAVMDSFYGFVAKF